MSSPYLLRIDGQIGDVFQIRSELGKEGFYIAPTQLRSDGLFGLFNCRTALSCNPFLLQDLIDIMHQISEQVDPPLSLRKGIAAYTLCLKQIEQTHCGKDTIE